MIYGESDCTIRCDLEWPWKVNLSHYDFKVLYDKGAELGRILISNTNHATVIGNQVIDIRLDI